jgi:hypothetical protein
LALLADSFEFAAPFDLKEYAGFRVAVLADLRDIRGDFGV